MSTSSSTIDQPSVGIAAALNRLTTVAALLLGLESPPGHEIVAVFEIDPLEAVTSTTIVTVKEPPGARLPAATVTVPLVPTGGPEQVPCVDAQETNAVPAGSGSVTVTRSAVAGPAFEPTSV